jgi:CTP synthase
VQPDILLCRCEHPLPENERAKIAAFCNVRKEAVIPALDAKSIYAVPLQYHEEGLDFEVLRAFGITPKLAPDLRRWEDILDRQQNPEGEVTIGSSANMSAFRMPINRSMKRWFMAACQPGEGQHPVDRR